MNRKPQHSFFKDPFVVFVFFSTVLVFGLWFSAQRGESQGAVAIAGEKFFAPARTEPIPASQARASELQDSFARVAEQAKPAVVSITAVHVESVQAAPYQFYFGDPFEEFFRDFQGQGAPRRQQPAPRQYQRRFEGMGSGVIVDPKGYVLTNEHVVRGAEELTVTLQEPKERKYSGKVIGSDPRSDLAVIKISAKEPFKFMALGDSKQARVGDWAIAMGSPFGLEQTMTVGIISAVRQSLNIDGKVFSDLLQTDAAINRGNSGGPLINIKGEVIGINTAIYAPTGVFAGIGFAIPVNRVKDIMGQLIEKGRVIRGWMGVEIMPLTEVLAQQFKVPAAEGVLVNNVVPGSPAEKAGVRRGDVITEFNGNKITNQESLMDMVGKTPPKAKVNLKVIRDGKPLQLSLVAGEAPALDAAGPADQGEAAPEKSPEGAEDWEGARLITVTPEFARQHELPPNVPGVVVLEVRPGELAYDIGLEPGDLVGSVNRQKTPDLKSFMQAVKKARPKEGMLMDVYRRGKWLFLSYKQAG